ncbi:glucoamylase family protein [Seonamhaeicola sp.]|uniref:glucoamylase family protein n=1 Tax=Seonamhaeicola sp. TaxID=1912245 RepID=UPI002609B162|nr:glucoamylase family protein [Seonamhaeicola sp.]
MRIGNIPVMVLFGALLLTFFNCSSNNETPAPEPVVEIVVQSIRVGNQNLSLDSWNDNIALDQSLTISFSRVVSTSNIESHITLFDSNSNTVPVDYAFLNNNKSVVLSPMAILSENATYKISISSTLLGAEGETFSGLETLFQTLLEPLEIELFTIDDVSVLENPGNIQEIGFQPNIKLSFSHDMDISDIENYMTLSEKNGSSIEIEVLYNESNKVYQVKPSQDLNYLTGYVVNISSQLKSINGNDFEGNETLFYTKVDEAFKFPEISDEALLTLVQSQTFKYFWDFAHPNSGMIRERSNNFHDNVITTGATGFGLMAIIVGIERGFITKAEGIERIKKIIDYLKDEVPRFHGMWPHWITGDTAEVIPFAGNEKDNGGDISESTYLIVGLLTIREYLKRDNETEHAAAISQINTFWNEMEWDWYTKNGAEDVLYWHWSPDYGWDINLQLTGYNETLITYIMAASSPTHSIAKEVYEKGFAQSGNMISNEAYYGYTLPLKNIAGNHGGPLFFSHYSYLGLDPRNLQDQYANYWDQGMIHTSINRAYCIDNPKGFIGYNKDFWGLTASDNHLGYSAHAPDNDLGVITPTAAISSMPYTPEYSMDALKYFYYVLGDRLWSDYGFYDAINPTENWVSDGHLGIDQGPIIIMIENHRTGLLWDLFMSCPEVSNGLDKLGFTY